MNTITQGPSRSEAVDWPAHVEHAVTAKGGEALLPEPSPGGMDGIQDGLSMMYALVAQQGQGLAQAGQVGVKAQTRQEQTQQRMEAAALAKEQADEASMNSGGGLFGAIGHLFSDIAHDVSSGHLWDAPVDAASDVVDAAPCMLTDLEQVAPKVAEYVGVAAAVGCGAAVTVASCGTAGVAVAAIAIGVSASGLVVSKTGVLGKDSAYVGLGLEVAGSALSFGTASAVGAGAAVQAATATMNATSGAVDVLAGASDIRVGCEQANVIDDSADVQQATIAMNRSQALVSDLVASLQSGAKSNTQALHAVAGAAQTYGQSLTTASAKA